MEATLPLSEPGPITAGIPLFSIIAIEQGDWTMSQIVREQHPTTDFRRSFARIGHAHTQMLVTLALLSATGRGATTPNGLIGLLSVTVAALGLGKLRTGIWLIAG